MPLLPTNLMRGLFPTLFHVKPIPRTDPRTTIDSWRAGALYDIGGGMPT